MADSIKQENKKHYISRKDSKRIARENAQAIAKFEKAKKRKAHESEYTTQMKDDNNIVEFDDLHTYFFSDSGTVKAVNGVTFNIPAGSTVGVVGESGCGKSVTSLSLMQLVQAPSGQIVSGSIRFRADMFKRDGRGRKIPVYETETDENGNQRIKRQGGGKYANKALLGLKAFGWVAMLAVLIAALVYYSTAFTPVDSTSRDVKAFNTALFTILLVVVAVAFIAWAYIVYKDIKRARQPLIQRNELGGYKYEMEQKVVDIAKMPTEVMRTIRGREISMIFQEPMTSLNPVFTIGNQLDEVGRLHIEGISKQRVKERSIEMLNLVGIADPEGVYKKYPHELSGGMRQRVMIAMALLCNPKLIVADEPTTALDVTIQAQILDLLRNIKGKINGSVMLITHDLGVVAEMADYVVVMYAGKIIEMGTAEDIYDRPLHPYTIGLQKSKPTVEGEVDELYCIPGFVPNPIDMPNYCYFRDRCEKCTAECAGEYPQLVKVSDTHSVSCYLYKGNNNAQSGAKEA